MTMRTDILSRFSGEGEAKPLYLPDLTLWYGWHHSRGTLPDQWEGYSLPEVAQAMGAPVFLVARPWREETLGLGIHTTEGDGERVIRSETSLGTLIARWTIGPDGDWWQAEYPVKTGEDLAAALELVSARTYVLDTSELHRMEAAVGEDGVLAIEIPRRPFSDLLHQLLGWSEGLMFLADSPSIVAEIIAALEAKLQEFVEQVSQLPGQVILSPDNLDGQYISPRVFQQYLAESYRLTADVLHRHSKQLLVHVGGPIRHILALLAQSGVDAIEGVAGPPQGDLSLAEAREVVGPGLTLWGGIPQDFLSQTHEWDKFESTVMHATQEAQGNSRMILGVADRVPVNAELARLEAIPSLVERASSA